MIGHPRGPVSWGSRATPRDRDRRRASRAHGGARGLSAAGRDGILVSRRRRAGTSERRFELVQVDWAGDRAGPGYRLTGQEQRGLGPWGAMTRFVGREPSSSTCGALARAGAGHGQVMALVGEPGVGKSRLVWEVTPRTAPHGWLVLAGQRGLLRQGHALPARDRPPQGLLCRSRTGTTRARSARRSRGKLLDAGRGPRADAAGVARPAGRARGRRRVAGARPAAAAPAHPRRRSSGSCCGRARSSRSCSSFEDLHWIDAETQALLDSLVESLPAARLLLLVNYRPEYQHALGRQDLLQPAPARPAARRSRRASCWMRSSAATPASRRSSSSSSSGPRATRSSWRRACGPWWRRGAGRASAGAYRLVNGSERSTCRPRSRRCWRRASTGCRAGGQALLQTASVIGKDVPGRAARRRSRRARRTALRRRARPPAGRRVPVRDAASSRTPSTPSSTRSLTRSPTGACSRSAGARFTPGSSRPSRRSIPIGSAEHVERLAHHALRGEVWEKAVAYLRQAGTKRGAARPTGRRWRGSSRRSTALEAPGDAGDAGTIGRSSARTRILAIRGRRAREAFRLSPRGGAPGSDARRSTPPGVGLGHHGPAPLGDWRLESSSRVRPACR